MAGAPRHRPLDTATDARLRMAARRKKYLRRRLMALAVLLALLIGLYFGVRWTVSRVWTWLHQPAVPTVSLPFVPAKYLKISLDGDPTELYVAVSQAENALRQIALVTGSQKSPKLIGEPITVAEFDIQVIDLPRAKQAVVLYQKLPAEGEPKHVTVGGEQAVEAAGSEPDFLAWKVDKTRGLFPIDYYQMAAPLQPPAPTAIVVDKYLNVLWFYEKGELVQTYRVATGRQIRGPNPTAATARVNQVTPEGNYTIANKIYGPSYYKEKLPPFDPKNPLGTRWLGFSVYAGDGAALWAIHGTHDPAGLGRWVSDGCIRLANPAVEWLYERVPVGTPLRIISSEPKA